MYYGRMRGCGNFVKVSKNVELVAVLFISHWRIYIPVGEVDKRLDGISGFAVAVVVCAVWLNKYTFVNTNHRKCPSPKKFKYRWKYKHKHNNDQNNLHMSEHIWIENYVVASIMLQNSKYNLAYDYVWH